MHVAYIHQHFSTIEGTTGTRSYEMSRRLIEAGHRVTMICGALDAARSGGESGERVTEMDLEGIRVLRVAEPYSQQMGFMRRLVAFGRFARKAGRLLTGLDPDVILASSTPLSAGIPGMKGARQLGVPFVFEVRDLWPELPIAMGVLKNPVLIRYSRSLERRIYRSADRVIALAPGIKEAIGRTGYPLDRVELIPNSADLDLFQPSDDRLVDDFFGPSDAFRLVFTGAHGVTNGLDAVLDAAAELKRRGAKGIRFVFIGEGNQRKRLMERSRVEGLESLISWVEPIPKKRLAMILPRMDVGLMILKNVPGFYYATSPNKFFDYLASGLPVLNNYPGWLAELIETHGCGIVVPPEDPAAFADAVIQLRENRDLVSCMGRKARQLAECEFSRRELGARFVRLLERVHEEHSSEFRT